jgi:hypothetical protein
MNTAENRPSSLLQSLFIVAAAFLVGAAVAPLFHVATHILA